MKGGVHNNLQEEVDRGSNYKFHVDKSFAALYSDNSRLKLSLVLKPSPKQADGLHTSTPNLRVNGLQNPVLPNLAHLPPLAPLPLPPRPPDPRDSSQALDQHSALQLMLPALHQRPPPRSPLWPAHAPCLSLPSALQLGRLAAATLAVQGHLSRKLLGLQPAPWRHR